MSSSSHVLQFIPAPVERPAQISDPIEALRSE
jgi:hypothetical protein